MKQKKKDISLLEAREEQERNGVNFKLTWANKDINYSAFNTKVLAERDGDASEVVNNKYKVLNGQRMHNILKVLYSGLEKSDEVSSTYPEDMQKKLKIKYVDIICANDREEFRNLAQANKNWNTSMKYSTNVNRRLVKSLLYDVNRNND